MRDADPGSNGTDLTWILHLILNFLTNHKSKIVCVLIRYFITFYNHTQFSSGLDCISFLNTIIAHSQFLQFSNSF